VNLSLLLARRYAFQFRNRRNLTHLISGISMFVIAAVTAAMVAILSAFNGIEGVVQQLFGTLDGPAAVVPIEGSAVPDSVAVWLAGQPEVAQVARVIEDDAVIRFGDEGAEVVTVLGLDSALLGMTRLDAASRYADRQWSDPAAEVPGVALGLGVRNKLGVGVGASGDQRAILTLSAPQRGKRLSRMREQAFQSQYVVATDVFSINADLDSRYVLVSLQTARELFNREAEISRVEWAPAEGVTVEEAVGGLALRLENTPYLVRTRAEKNALITKTNRAEKWATFAILSFILIVAAFNVMASLTMLLLDKRGDIEVLQALGFTGRRLERAFSLQGLLINTIGGLGGAGIGLLLVKGQERYGWLKLEGSVVPAYPVALEWLDVAGVLAVVLLIGGLGSALMVRVLVRRMTSMRWAV
jgi:lipoprotein-releasing system permease protein